MVQKKKSVKKPKTKSNSKKNIGLKTILIIAGLFIVAFIALVIWSGGASAYKYNSTKFNDAVGSWDLANLYVDTAPVKRDPTVLVINKDDTATITVTKTITPEIENEDGTITPAETEDATTAYTLETSGDTITMMNEGKAVVYDFSVDEDAEILHLWTTINDKTYHYLYNLKEE